MSNVASWVIEDLKTPGKYFYDLLVKVIYAVFTGPYLINPEAENQSKFFVPYSALVQMGPECTFYRTVIYFVMKKNHDNHKLEARRLMEKLANNSDDILKSPNGKIWGILVEGSDTYVYFYTSGDTIPPTERKFNTARDLETILIEIKDEYEKQFK